MNGSSKLISYSVAQLCWLVEQILLAESSIKKSLADDDISERVDALLPTCRGLKKAFDKIGVVAEAPPFFDGSELASNSSAVVRKVLETELPRHLSALVQACIHSGRLPNGAAIAKIDTDLAQENLRLQKIEEDLKRRQKELTVKEGILSERVFKTTKLEDSLNQRTKADGNLETRRLALNNVETELKTFQTQLEQKTSELEAREKELIKEASRLHQAQKDLTQRRADLEAQHAETEKKLGAELQRKLDELAGEKRKLDTKASMLSDQDKALKAREDAVKSKEAAVVPDAAYDELFGLFTSAVEELEASRQRYEEATEQGNAWLAQAVVNQATGQSISAPPQRMQAAEFPRSSNGLAWDELVQVCEDLRSGKLNLKSTAAAVRKWKKESVGRPDSINFTNGMTWETLEEELAAKSLADPKQLAKRIAELRTRSRRSHK